jgi:uncharacterized protein YneF (UPF0154 family)
MIKEFLMKKVLQRQLKDVPPAQREQIMTMVEKDPKLFEQIAKEIKAEMKKRGDKDQNAAAMVVMPKYQKQLQALMGPPQRMPQRFNTNGSIRK